MTGRVILVGAGPGDPELITVKGAKALAAADVVVYDRLAAPALLDLAPSAAERIYVGKQPGGHAMRQEEINEVLVDQARLGRTVVRLKGGDPFMFGRGGEELLACAEGGIPCEVVPGITSALSAPASAGIPVTHRGLARSVAVVTASLVMWATTPEERTVIGSLSDLPALAAAASMGPPATLVVGVVAALPREIEQLTRTRADRADQPPPGPASPPRALA